MLNIPTLKDAPTQRQVVEILSTAGIVVLPGWMDSSRLKAIQEEVATLLYGQAESAESLDYSTGRAVRIETSKMPNFYRALRREFGLPWMRETARLFFRGESYAFNYDMIAVRDIVGTDHAARRPHYDRTPNLKFFAYLTDTTEETGAFCCVPGSHNFAKEVQAENRAIRRLPQQNDTRILPESMTEGLLPVEAPAGSLLVIDSDIVHCGAPVRSGHRVAVRSRSYDPIYA